MLSGSEPVGVVGLVLSAVVRIATHPRIFDPASTIEEAFEFCDGIRSAPNAVVLTPGPRHWDIFAQLCADAKARGNLVPDAYLAAFAVETGSEWITTDGDYRRFQSLTVRHPLDG